MTDAKNPGAVEVTQADVAEKAARHRIAAQPAATSQEVGREDNGGPCYCWCHPNAGAIGCSPCCAAEDNYLPPSKRDAALAEPAAKAECPSRHGMNIACPDGCGRDPATGELNGTRLEPAAKAGDAMLHERIMQEMWASEDEEGELHKSWRLGSFERLADAAIRAISSPSPQPDMGSGIKVRKALEEIQRRTGLLLHQNTGRWDMRKEHDKRTVDVLTANQSIAEEAIAALSPASQSVEKMTEALKNLAHFADDHGLEQERGGVAIMKAAWDALSTLPHKEEATPAPQDEGLREQYAKIALSYADSLKPAVGWTGAQVQWWEFGVTDAASAIAAAIRATPATTTERGRG